MDCDVTHEQLAAYGAGDADAELAARIEEHLPSCEACRRLLEAIGQTDSALRLLPRIAPPAAALLAARQALSAELHRAGAPEVLTIEEAAQFLRVSPDDLDDVMPELPVFEVGGQIRVRRSKMIQWIEKRERAHARERAQSDIARILAGLTVKEQGYGGLS
jgi:hypothetical protein